MCRFKTSMYVKQSKTLQIKKNIPTFLYTVREIQPINWYVEMSPAARLGWLRCGRWAPPPPPPPCPESPPAIACTCMLAQSQYDYAGYGFDPQTTLIMYTHNTVCLTEKNYGISTISATMNWQSIGYKIKIFGLNVFRKRFECDLLY